MEEATAVTCRRTTHLPLDDCLFTLQRFIPHLTRSSLHRLYQRHGISRLPLEAGAQTKGQPFRAYAIGYVHLVICDIRTSQDAPDRFHHEPNHYFVGQNT